MYKAEEYPNGSFQRRNAETARPFTMAQVIIFHVWCDSNKKKKRHLKAEKSL